ncbi:MAG TPA: hypothetical protein VKU00_34000, partial [Chthonomonadaceae bacterium]|nr:hypothetical protein [Chthonomonadaceae bacterium]
GLSGIPLSDELLDTLRSIESVREAERVPPSPVAEGKDAPVVPGEMLRLRAEQPNRVLSPLVAALTAADLSVTSLTIKHPNLEDVFLALTGKSLRD